MSYWPLTSIALVVLGFALRWNAVVVVVAAGLLSGLLGGLSILDVLALLGETFAGNRALLLFILTLPAVGVLERSGLREHAQAWISRMRAMWPSVLRPSPSGEPGGMSPYSAASGSGIAICPCCS